MGTKQASGRGAGAPTIRLKRAYEPPSRGDGERILVERLWPRGVRKEDLALASWAKEVAPSAELRRWFGHREERWEEFVRRYRAELDGNEAAWRPLLDAAAAGPVTFVFAARDPERCSARVLRDYLGERLGGA